MFCPLGGQLWAGNLIVNGDFEQGNTGFTSSYAYTPGTNTDATQYTVASNPAVWNPSGGVWSSYGDHTSGSGLMMIANGATAANTLVWGETVSVTPNALYNFSTWVSSTNSFSPADLDFVFNGGTPISYGAPSVPGVWQQFATQWNSGANTSANIQIFDSNLAYNGNDFALDDISLTPAPEPSTLALLGVGAIGLVGYGLRRRRQRRLSAAAVEATAEESPAILSFPSRTFEAKRRAA